MKTIWQKTADATGAGDWFYEFTAAEDRQFDHHLIPYDIFTNLAQARMLEKVGIFNQEESTNTASALIKLYSEWERGSYQLSNDDEDVHSAIEKYLTQELGNAGKKIHTGRSRNDQVLNDIRLFLKQEIRSVASTWLSIAGLLHKLAKDNRGIHFAGFTHTQPAMPTSVDAWAAGYLELLIADLKSLQKAYETNDSCPLGSAAGYGVPYFNVDRDFISELLGFAKTQQAVTACQLSRGTFELRIINALGYGAGTFNRLASDVIWFLNPLMDLVQLSDDQVSGSSIMPQKRNPDVWELIRGSHHEFSGWSVQMSSLGTNLTSGYHRDLQLTKKVVMQSTFAAERLSVAVKHALEGLKFNPDVAKRSLTPDLLATHKANEFVKQGMTFREAYRKVADELESINVDDYDDLSATYNHIGSPGSYNEDYYARQINQSRNWLAQEDEKWNSIKMRLLKP